VAEDTVLVVDADAKTRGVLEISLKKAGYGLHVVERAREAIEWLEEGGNPGLIIADTELPGMSGFDFCAQVKENLDWEPIPFIFLADAGSSEEKRRGFELGVEDFLTRPVYVKEVVTRVQLLLQRRKKELLDVADAERVTGRLEDVTLLDLLQAIEDKDRTGQADLERERHRGVIYFREGRVIDAAVGKLRGADAVYRMMQWNQGTYAVRYTAAINRRERITESTQDLLLTGMKALDAFNDMSSAGPGLDRVYEVNYRQLADHLRDIPDEVNGLIRLFDGHRSVEDVVDDSSLGPAETLKVLGKLVDQELLYDVTPKQSEEGDISTLAASEGSLDNWLGMEAAETVGATAPAPVAAAETETEKVRRRREERKRRKTAARRRRTSEHQSVQVEERQQWAQAARARKELTQSAGDDEEVAALRSQIAAAEARAEELRVQTDALLETKRSQMELAEHLNTQERKAVSGEQVALMARLAEAEKQAAQLAAERTALARELQEQKDTAASEARAAAKAQAEAEHEARRIEEAAIASAALQAQQAAEAARQEAEATARAQAEEAARKEAEEAQRQAAQALQQEEAEREAARVKAEAAAKAQTELQQKEAAMQARLAEEQARLAAARAALAEAKANAEAEAAQLEQARIAREAAAKAAADERALQAKETQEREAIRGELAELEAMIKAQEAAAANARREAERLSAAAEAQEAVVDWVAATPDAPETPAISVDATSVENEEEEAEAPKEDPDATKAVPALAAVAVAATAIAAADEPPAPSHVDARLADLEAARKDDLDAARSKASDKDPDAAAAAVIIPPLPEEDPSDRTRSPETDMSADGTRIPRPTDPELALAQDEFFTESRDEEAYYAEPPPPQENKNTLYMVLAVVGGLLLFGALYYAFKDDAPKKPHKPVASAVKPSKADAGGKKADAGKGKTDAVAAARPDAGAEADTGDADAAVVELPSEETVIAATKKASETVWSVALMQAAYNPDTGEELIRPDGVEAPVVEDAKDPKETKPAGKTEKSDKGVAARVPREKDDRVPSDIGKVPSGKDDAVAELDDAGKRAAFSKHLKAGQRYIKQRNYDKALAELSEANQIAPGSYRVNHLMGVANYYKGRYKQAIPYLERAVRLKSTSADSVAALGDAYQATGRTSKALDAYKKYLKLRPKGRRSDQLREIIARYH
jgi:DNA-binding response OmpR family regulator